MEKITFLSSRSAWILCKLLDSPILGITEQSPVYPATLKSTAAQSLVGRSPCLSLKSLDPMSMC